jgi:hypothetical protein
MIVSAQGGIRWGAVLALLFKPLPDPDVHRDGSVWAHAGTIGGRSPFYHRFVARGTGIIGRLRKRRPADDYDSVGTAVIIRGYQLIPSSRNRRTTYAGGGSLVSEEPRASIPGFEWEKKKEEVT